jgi:hypothetical protein
MFNVRSCLFVGLILILAAYPLAAQRSECPPAAVLISPTDPAYTDAMALKQTLESNGFIVRCVFPTKLGSIFEVDEAGELSSTIEGEASFRTNYGDIGAVFLPRQQTFADFKITEHRKTDGYLYTFTGTPSVWAGNQLDSARWIQFLKHGNWLLISDNLQVPLEQALNVRKPSMSENR